MKKDVESGRKDKTLKEQQRATLLNPLTVSKPADSRADLSRSRNIPDLHRRSFRRSSLKLLPGQARGHRGHRYRGHTVLINPAVHHA